MKGSTFYFKNEITNIIRSFGYDNVMPMGPRESAIAIANNILYNYKETHEDIGLIIYPEEGSNPKTWKDLREQIQLYFKNINLGEPIVISGLVTILKNDNYEHDLRLLISNELTKVDNVPVPGMGNGEFNSTDPSLLLNGFPSHLNKRGDRYLSTSDNGVCRLVRTIFLDIYARDSRLDFSTPAGRTHLIKY